MPVVIETGETNLSFCVAKIPLESLSVLSWWQFSVSNAQSSPDPLWTQANTAWYPNRHNISAHTNKCSMAQQAHLLTQLASCNNQMLLVLLRRSLNVLEQVIEDACKASSGPALSFSRLGFEPGLSPGSTNFCRVDYL